MCDLAYHWDRHRDYQEISNDISRSKYSQHIKGVGTFRQEECDRSPVKAPIYSTLKDCSKEECCAPGNYDSNHDPADYVESLNMAKNSSP